MPGGGDPWRRSSTAAASRNGRRHSLGGGDSAETRIISSMVAENPRKFVVSDLLTLVTLAGAYYCINKIKSILV